MATAKKTTAAPAKAADADAPKVANPADELGAGEIQAKFDEANEKGYFGHTPDQTPNENYTLAGVTSDKPTPETQRGQ